MLLLNSSLLYVQTVMLNHKLFVDTYNSKLSFDWNDSQEEWRDNIFPRLRKLVNDDDSDGDSDDDDFSSDDDYDDDVTNGVLIPKQERKEEKPIKYVQNKTCMEVNYLCIQKDILFDI